jgi:hypothetical protein
MVLLAYSPFAYTMDIWGYTMDIWGIAWNGSLIANFPTQSQLNAIKPCSTQCVCIVLCISTPSTQRHPLEIMLIRYCDLQANIAARCGPGCILVQAVHNHDYLY